jgi:hypothetical protein
MKKSRIYNRFITGGIAALLALAGSFGQIYPAFAVGDSAGKIAITLSPTSQRIELKPGKITAGEFTVMNDGTIDTSIRVYAAPYQVTPDYATNDFENNTKWTQISRWITFGPENLAELILDMPASTRETIQFSVNVPASVPFGGQYAAIMAETVGGNTGSGVKAVHRVASLIYSEVAGDTLKKGEVIKRDWQGWYKSSIIKTGLTLKNSGNIDFTVSNTLAVKSFFSDKVMCEEKPKTITMLPDTEREVDLSCDTGKTVGLYRVAQRSEYLGEISEATRTVFVMPLYILILLVVAIAALILLLAVLLKRISRKKKGS